MMPVFGRYFPAARGPCPLLGDAIGGDARRRQRHVRDEVFCRREDEEVQFRDP